MAPDQRPMPLTSPACRYLFVYGTLRKGAEIPEASLLARMCRLVGTGKINARLYDIGAYPGMVKAERPDEWVMGEVHEMFHPERLLQMLDDYEGCGPKHQRPYEFEREVVKLTLNHSMPTEAWVYWYRPDPSKFRRIISGDYLTEKK